MQESGFDPTAENAGALGLMQLRPFVAKDYARRARPRLEGRSSLYDPVRNIQLASGYFGELIDRFESLDLALAAYNKGPECVKRQLRNGNDDSPTARFAIDVLSRYQRYNSRFGGLLSALRRLANRAPRRHPLRGEGSMRQVWIPKAGAPEVLEVREARDPIPKPARSGSASPPPA